MTRQQIQDLRELCDRLRARGFSWRHEDYLLLKETLPEMIAREE